MASIKLDTDIVGLTPSISLGGGKGVVIFYGTGTINNRHIDWVTTIFLSRMIVERRGVSTLSDYTPTRLVSLHKLVFYLQ